MKDRNVLTVALLHINKSAYSETFIHEVIKRLPGNVVELYGGEFPTFSRTKGALMRKSYIILERVYADLFGKESDFFKKRVLARFLRKNRVDVVLAEYGPVGARVASTCKKLNIPLVTHFHGYDAYSDDILNRYRQKYGKLFSYGTRFITVSHDMTAQLQALGCPAGKIVYNPCGVDTDAFIGADSSTASPSFTYVGRFVFKKGCHYAILAFAKAVKSHPEAKLYMIGDGSDIFVICKQMVTAMNLQDNIIFLGSRSPDQIIQQLRQSRGYIQHSITAPDHNKEGSPVSIMEASSMGLPVISTKHCGINQIVAHGETGYLVEEGDVDSMADYIIRIIEDPALAKRLGDNGRKKMLQEYTMERYVGNIEKVLDDAVVR